MSNPRVEVVTTRNFHFVQHTKSIESQTHSCYHSAQFRVCLSVLSLVHLRKKCRGLSAEFITQRPSLKHLNHEFTATTWDFTAVNSMWAVNSPYMVKMKVICSFLSFPWPKSSQVSSRSSSPIFKTHKFIILTS